MNMLVSFWPSMYRLADTLLVLRFTHRICKAGCVPVRHQRSTQAGMELCSAAVLLRALACLCNEVRCPQPALRLRRKNAPRGAFQHSVRSTAVSSVHSDLAVCRVSGGKAYRVWRDRPELCDVFPIGQLLRHLHLLGGWHAVAHHITTHVYVCVVVCVCKALHATWQVRSEGGSAAVAFARQH